MSTEHLATSAGRAAYTAAAHLDPDDLTADIPPYPWLGAPAHGQPGGDTTHRPVHAEGTMPAPEAADDGYDHGLDAMFNGLLRHVRRAMPAIDVSGELDYDEGPIGQPTTDRWRGLTPDRVIVDEVPFSIQLHTSPPRADAAQASEWVSASFAWSRTEGFTACWADLPPVEWAALGVTFEAEAEAAAAPAADHTCPEPAETSQERALRLRQARNTGPRQRQRAPRQLGREGRR